MRGVSQVWPLRNSVGHLSVKIFRTFLEWLASFIASVTKHFQGYWYLKTIKKELYYPCLLYRKRKIVFKYCYACGHLIDRNRRFCRHMGSSLLFYIISRASKGFRGISFRLHKLSVDTFCLFGFLVSIGLAAHICTAFFGLSIASVWLRGPSSDSHSL